MSFFRSDSKGNQTKILEVAISVESWGEAEYNMGRFVFRKSWSPLVHLLLICSI